MRTSINFAALTCLWSVLGCNKAEPTPAAPSRATSPPIVAEATGITPRYASVEVSVSDRGGSCTLTFKPLPIGSAGDITHGCRLGRQGTLTDLSWEYLGTTDEGDRYEFERTYIAGETVQSTIEMEVVFSGKELLLFDDEDSTVRMRLAVSNKQSVRNEKAVEPE